ncbi:MAG: hypothetical protein V1716_05230 [Candidatus Uhrbacteria bacterium]
MRDFLTDLLFKLADELPMWNLVPLIAVIWLIIGTGLVTIQFVLAGLPIGWLSWSAASLFVLFAPIHVAILTILAWMIVSDFNEFVPEFIIWVLWPFTPAIVDTVSSFLQLEHPLTANFLFAWRYESVWAVLVVIVFTSIFRLWWTERYH